MKGVGGAVLANWEISGITHLQSGAHLTPTASVNTGRSVSLVSQTTSVAPIQASNPTITQWLNPAAFAAPSATPRALPE